ncbi:MAG: Flp family type IVb pilin [Acidimicrobiales bacterium]
MRAERGASLVEYALLLGLIALLCFAAIGYIGRETADSFERNGSSMFVDRP